MEYTGTVTLVKCGRYCKKLKVLCGLKRFFSSLADPNEIHDGKTVGRVSNVGGSLNDTKISPKPHLASDLVNSA